MVSVESIHKVVLQLTSEAEQFLCDLIKFPSVSGQEHEAMLFLYDTFKKLSLNVEKVELSDSIVSDPDYSCPIPDLKYNGRFNLRIVHKGSGSGRTLLISTHVDVVPPSEGMSDAWSPRVEDRIVFGRGSCDAKGQIATIFLVFKAMEILQIKFNGNIVVHLVVEEENGGNGTLAMIRRGEKADGCIVMETCEGKVCTSCRGAVWFRLLFNGKAGHSGQPEQTRSALLMARDAINILEQYHADLLEQSRGIALFDAYSNPMPITFGRIKAGSWPATAPSVAILEGVLGLLPNKTKEEVCHEIRQVLINNTNEFFANNFELSFTFRHDCSVVDPLHELPQAILNACQKVDTLSEVGALVGGSDTWFYNNKLGIPTVAYGPGTMKVAHSKDEHISMNEIATAAEVLIILFLDYCGISRK